VILIANTNTQIDNSQEATTSQVEQKPVPIEVKWNIPAWMMRHPGPRIEVEDDDLGEE
jgi:hypothetical protein